MQREARGKRRCEGLKSMRQQSARGLHLLATTSVIALSLVAMPVAVDLHSPLPVLKVAMADSCCFIGDTKVLMADGTERPIRDVRVGDLVMGASGHVGRVKQIERPHLGTRLLYALNGGPAFVTAEHPFATLGGWRAVDPAATARENPNLTVKRLRVGDCLQTGRVQPQPLTAGNLALTAPALTPVVLLSLTAEPAARDTILYNLLLDGEHTYFANGYLVHNKGDGPGAGGSSGGSDSGDSGGDDSGGDDSGNSGPGGGESGESGGSSESGESGSSGSGNVSGSPDSRSSFDQIQQIGPDLSPDEEAETISKGWQ